MDDMTRQQRHDNMRQIRSADTKPEIMLRRALWHSGFRYRKNWKFLPGCPDIVLTRQKICIFVDGEYFHGKDWWSGQKQKVQNGNHSEYWVPKIEKNIARDRRVDAELKGLGWNVIRFWSRDVLADSVKCVDAVKESVFLQNLNT